jgi:hypothetical protein
MDNLMQPFSLRVSEVIDHAARYHPNRKIISRNIEGSIIETSWIKIHHNSKRLSIKIFLSNLLIIYNEIYVKTTILK